MTRGGARRALEYRLFRALRVALGLVPERVAVRLGGLLGLLAGSVLRLRRADVDRHLELAFPDREPSWRAAAARASYVHLGRESVILFRLGGWSAARVRTRTRVRGWEELLLALQAGRGVVLLTGHLGNWEIGGAAMAARGLPIDGVAKAMANRRFERDLFASRERLGLRIIETGAAPRAVLRSLRRGRVVGMLGDQNTHRDPVFIPFFGTPAATSKGPALFALRSGAPVFLGLALREPGWRQRYEISLERLEFRPTGRLEEDVRSLTGAYSEALERAVRLRPEQYFWQHRRWKTRPPRSVEAEGGHSGP